MAPQSISILFSLTSKINMFAKTAFTVVSIASSSLAWSNTCYQPFPSSAYTSGIPTWLSEDFTCTGPPHIWNARPSPGKGMGVFATRAIEAGTIILKETPVIRIQPPEFRNGVAYPLAGIELLIRTAFEDLGEDEKADVMSLTAHDPAEQNLNDVIAIFRNNAYIMGTNNSDLGLFPKGARINHSCRPNTSQTWHEKTGRRVVRAIRRIDEGEELFATYIPLLHSHDMRQKRLNQYGFTCTCSVCAQEEAEQKASDKRRQDIRTAFNDLEAQLSLSVPKSAKGKKKVRKNLQASMQLVALVEEEGLADYYAQAYRIVAVNHARLEDWESAALWAHKSYQLRVVEDEDSPATLEMQSLTGRFIESWNEEVRNKSMRQG
jgi:hypothetical protein